jgi:hypothetical protein
VPAYNSTGTIPYVPDMNGKCVANPCAFYVDSSGHGHKMALGPDGTCVEVDAQGYCKGTNGLGADASNVCVRPRPARGTGGSGLSSFPPNLCQEPPSAYSVQSYTDAHSLCVYLNEHRLGGDCGHYCTNQLNIDDPALNAEAQAEADAVAAGAPPKGIQDIAGGSAQCPDGPFCDSGSTGMYVFMSSGLADVPDVDSNLDNIAKSQHRLYTSPDADWFIQFGAPASLKACGFFRGSMIMRGTFFDFPDGPGIPGGLDWGISKIGCGVAVDTNGITWRTFKLAP